MAIKDIRFIAALSWSPGGYHLLQRALQKPIASANPCITNTALMNY